MAYLAIATALIGLLAAVNLVFTLGVIRRLREQSAELVALRGAPARHDSVTLPIGSRVGAFTAESIDGHPVTLDTLGARPLVGFFSPSCVSCTERVPGFVSHAASRPGGPDGILAIVVGAPQQSADLVNQLRPVATVVAEAEQGPLQQAFGVDGSPAFVLVRDGRVQVTSFELTPIIESDGAASPAIG